MEVVRHHFTQKRFAVIACFSKHRINGECVSHCDDHIGASVLDIRIHYWLRCDDGIDHFLFAEWFIPLDESTEGIRIQSTDSIFNCQLRHCVLLRTTQQQKGHLIEAIFICWLWYSSSEDVSLNVIAQQNKCNLCVLLQYYSAAHTRTRAGAREQRTIIINM